MGKGFRHLKKYVELEFLKTLSLEQVNKILCKYDVESRELKQKIDLLNANIELLKINIRNIINCHWLKVPRCLTIDHCTGCTYQLVCPDAGFNAKKVGK